jgi:hypothetical protein
MAIDTRMNGIIHAALRRDLDRTAMVLDGLDPVSETRLRAIGTHVVWLMDLLHSHHTTEDERLFPVIRRNNPGAAGLLDEMETEHSAIAGAVTSLEAAGRRAEAGEPGSADTLRDAVAALRTVLDPHLAHEERDLAPLVPESVAEAEWREFEKSNTAGKKPPVLAMQGHWMIDNLSPAGVEVVTSVVPAVPRFIMLRLLGGPYRRRREACWGGTPAAAVPATPLTF